MSEDKNTEDLHCSFCGKSQNEVKKLIAGRNVFICHLSKTKLHAHIHCTCAEQKSSSYWVTAYILINNPCIIHHSYVCVILKQFTFQSITINNTVHLLF